MERAVASKLKLLVNSPEFKDISLYTASRTAGLFKALLQASTMEQVAELRGRILELERLNHLREEVLEGEKDA